MIIQLHFYHVDPNARARLGSLEALKERIEELESYLSPDGPVVKGEVEALRKSAEELKE